MNMYGGTWGKRRKVRRSEGEEEEEEEEEQQDQHQRLILTRWKFKVNESEKYVFKIGLAYSYVYKSPQRNYLHGRLTTAECFLVVVVVNCPFFFPVGVVCLVSSSTSPPVRAFQLGWDTNWTRNPEKISKDYLHFNERLFCLVSYGVYLTRLGVSSTWFVDIYLAL